MVGVRGQAGRPTGQHLQQAVIGLYAGHHQGLLVPVLPLQKTPASSLQRHIIQVSQHTPYWSCWQLSPTIYVSTHWSCWQLSPTIYVSTHWSCWQLSPTIYVSTHWPCWQLSPTIYVSTHSLLALLATVSYYLCVNTQLTGPAGNCLLLSMCQHTPYWQPTIYVGDWLVLLATVSYYLSTHWSCWQLSPTIHVSTHWSCWQLSPTIYVGDWLVHTSCSTVSVLLLGYEMCHFN